MKLAIHQAHYFPWLGYLDKMAKADKFVILDEVQLTRQSNMFRNRFLTKDGREKFLSVSFERKNFMKKMYCEIELNNSVLWQKEHMNFLKDNYRKAPYFDEIFPKITNILEKKYENLCEVTIDSVLLLKDIFDIPTEILFQSDIDYDKDKKNSDLMLEICKKIGASFYLSGNGAREYMKIDTFVDNNIKVVYQTFSHPIYSQIESKEFVTNLSALDILFYCGVDKSKKIFWNNVEKSNEF